MRASGNTVRDVCKCSVIIPTYNRVEMIGTAVESVLSHVGSTCEVIVVDDGSTDGTSAVLARYVDQITILRQNNRGPGAARNLGIRHARGAYIAFLDSDDFWLPWTLSTYLRVIEEHGNPAIVVGKPRFAHSAAGSVDQLLESQETGTSAFSDYLASGDEWRWWGVSSFVVRADWLRKVEGFNAKHCNAEDADLMLRLGTAPGFVQITHPDTFGYRIHAGCATANLGNSLAGIQNLVDSENRGAYPGGEERAWQRRRIIARHLRPVSLELLGRGRQCDAWRLYSASFRWHLVELRWKYLLGFIQRAMRFRAARTFCRKGEPSIA